MNLSLPRCARRGFRCAPRLRRAPQSGDAHSKRATGATCPFGTNGVPIRAVASRPLWIPRRESPCDPARRAGILRGCLRRMPGARYARRPLKGPRRPFGTRFEPPTAESFVRKQGAKLAPLENPPTAHVQSAAGRRLVPPHPTIRLSEGSPGTHGGKQRPFRAFARFARVRGEAAQFSASPWDMRAKLKRTCIPYGNSRYGSGDSRAEALRPRRGGWRDAEGSLAHPWTGRRRLWPKANRRRRWGSRGHGPLRLLSPISCPYKKWGRLPGRDPATPPLPERQI